MGGSCWAAADEDEALEFPLAERRAGVWDRKLEPSSGAGPRF